MIGQNTLSLNKIDFIELHYLFNDETHCMDAILQNRCEYEFLGVLKQVATVFNAEIIIETEPLAEGGLRRWFNVVIKNERNKAIITTAAITAILTTVITTPIGTAMTVLTNKVIEKIFEDKELKKDEHDKRKLELEDLRMEIEIKRNILESSNVIRKKKSNFYEKLDEYPKVNRIAFVAGNKDKSEEIILNKDKFREFVLHTDELEPIGVDNAIIEIISPVLKKGKYKWTGIYSGNVIVFNMISKDFKEIIQNGIVQFKNGTTIKCDLEISRKVDNEGQEIIVGYKVVRVHEYYENEKPIETPEGKKHRQNKELEKMQTNLFSQNAE